MTDKLLVSPGMNLLKLQRYQQHESGRVRLGLPTWESAKLKGTLYDFDTPPAEFLAIYASQYDVVEYQHSFTDAPSQREMKELYEIVHEVNPHFQFTPVIPRHVSHECSLGENLFDLKEFVTNVKALNEHLGPCILRLPETFSPLQMKQLDKFWKHWPEELELAIHFTHMDWFRKPSFMMLLARELEGTKKSIVIEDRLELPMPAEKLLCSDHLLVRFFSRPSMGITEDRLAMWVYKLGEYKGLGIKKSYFVLNEQEEMCLSYLKKMANSIGGACRVPASYDVNSKQMNLFL